MKTFGQLTSLQQEAAVQARINLLLGAAQDGVRFHGDLQAKLEAAAVEAERMRTPWFWAEIAMETCKDDLTEIATLECREATFIDHSKTIYMDEP